MKCTKKKFVSTLCLAVSLLTVSAPTVFAADLQTPTSNAVVSPRMTYISDSSCNLSIRNGQASVSGSVSGYIGEATKCSITIELQEKSGLSWTTVGTWSNSAKSDYTSASGSKSVTAGKTYRARASVTVWAGSKSESQTVTTSKQTA